MARIHKRDAEQNFPHRFDVPVPPGGLGKRLNQMSAWCLKNIRAEDWEQHSHSEKQPGEMAWDFARFHFLQTDDAELFRQKWLSDKI